MKTAGIVVLTILAAGMALPSLADSLPMDTAVTLSGIETVCTGIGSSKDESIWSQYPVRVEFSNGGSQYLAGAHVTLTGKMASPLTFDCQGSWVLFRLPAGKYKVSAVMASAPNGPSASTIFVTSGSGPQKRVELQFPHVAANQ
jgi:hypothetical protein